MSFKSGWEIFCEGDREKFKDEIKRLSGTEENMVALVLINCDLNCLVKSCKCSATRINEIIELGKAGKASMCGCSLFKMKYVLLVPSKGEAERVTNSDV